MRSDFHCMLSGVSVGGPPNIFPGKQEPPFVVDHLVKLLSAMQHPGLPPSEELTNILTEALSLRNAIASLYHASSRWCYPVAVFGPCEPNTTNPTYLRFCRSPSLTGPKSFDFLRQSDSRWTGTKTRIEQYHGVGPRCAFIDLRCWYYIQSWFDVFPPGSNRNASEANFAKMLWEFVEGRFDHHHRLPECILPELDYGPIRLTFRSQGSFWVDYSGAYVGVADIEGDTRRALRTYCPSETPRLSEAIGQGLRGEALFPAFRSDVSGWMFDEPDMWPALKEETATLKFQTYAVQPTHFPSFHDHRYSKHTAICKSMRNLLTHENVFVSMLHKMVHLGSLRWVKPCAMVEGEVEAARGSLLTWIGPPNAEECYREEEPLLSPRFLWIPFIHACLRSSDSIRNRKRLWDMAKQLEGMWNPDIAEWQLQHQRDDPNDEHSYSTYSLLENSSHSEEDNFNDNEGEYEDNSEKYI
ncbi:hypothetical protein DL96DRAFT_1749596 [Flagelloscypha sp. PMI_526]|nr:hypothetical protein DL96DRAFT_1749596 [Flagelloscypha sp. PMI_526]